VRWGLFSWTGCARLSCTDSNNHINMKSFIAKVLGVGSAVWKFYAPVLRALFISGASALLPLALTIVRELAASDKTGAEKRAFAIGRLRNEATAIGVSATESLLRFTIESAVQRMRLEDK
jgi:hypothetical protein